MAERDYLVTARKYRPSLFREVVAQEHVTDTLKNAIKLDRLAHAYLFSGPRGVGKTTAARILAKAINCETPRDEREDGAEPCCECDSCVAFEDGGSLNVFEMDAASNNRVDDIRELREKVRIPPQGEQKKVYILDEVHMLSKQAFNALLKTLEEPPAHALFIFATTEPHKVLPTILSRCQRFDFRRIPVPRIVDRLREVCETEGVEADEESLMLLARKGNGALRDALSAFDQALSLCGTTLEYGELAQAMGVVDQDLYFDLTGHVAQQNTAGMLELVRHVVRSGYDLQEFLVGLAEHLRNLLVVDSLGGDALEGVAEATRTRYVEEAEHFGEADLLRLLTVAGEAEEDVKNSPQPRLKLETTLLKMAQMRRAADLRTVIQKVERLEQMVEDGTLPESLPVVEGAAEKGAEASSQEAEPESSEPTPSYKSESEDEDRSSAEASTAPESGTSDPSSEGEGAAVPAAPAPPVSAREDAVSDPQDADDAEDDEESAIEQEEFTPPTDGTDDEDDDPSAAQQASFTPPTEETDEEEEDGSAGSTTAGDTPERSGDGGSTTESGTEQGEVEYGDLFGTPALGDDSTSDGGDASADDEDGTDNEASAEAASQATIAEPPVETSTAEVETLAEEWPQFVKFVKQDQISLGSLLGETEPVELADGVLTVAVPKPLHRDSLREDRALLLERLADRFDTEIDEMRFVVEEESTDAEGEAVDDEPMNPREQLQELRETYTSLDVLFEEFGAEPVW